MKRRTRKRTLLIPRMLLLLTGGAIINVAVAWGILEWPSHRHNTNLAWRMAAPPGWPLHALDYGLGTPEVRFSASGAFDPPLHPIWPSFAINTMFYAAILWLLIAAPGKILRRIRARRGQCPACAYPVGTNEVCTECGALVTASCVKHSSSAATPHIR